MRTMRLDNGDEWQYEIGKANVVFVPPSGKGKKFYKDFATVTGLTADQVQRAVVDRNLAITPATIKHYILSLPVYA